MTTATTEVSTKTPSKKSLALAIFSAKLLEREAGLFGDNKSFRAAVLTQIESDLGVSRASAATMYNSAKKEAEAAGTAKLGRDPKKVKVRVGNGKRGRPAGSKNRPKTIVTPAVTETTEVAPATEVVA